MDNKELTWRNFLAPKYWPVWLMIGLLRITALLPFSAGITLGRCMGNLLYRVLPKRRHITEVNIRLCFKELDKRQQQQMVREVFQNNGIGLIEMAWAYWGSKAFFRSITALKGADILDEALSQNNGVILMGGHYSHIDLCGLLFSFYGRPVSTLYRKHNNPLLEMFFFNGRQRFSEPLERSKTRLMLRHMRKNNCIWYAPDQDITSKDKVFVPFFGQTAATITATTKIARLNGSPLLLLSCLRNPDDKGYTLEVSRVENFPSGDETEDARLINEALESSIRKAPSQYMWVHKRFKTQPDGKSKLYK
ncbi:LpxL/LpxP family acyltransferase [Aliamphritea hakodatensis]|uniref:LpxL/LpxP family acyltransferase n=1 Tax=Aliamphritea hakodatensis TaxID=2895352 RepID=UPI0022FD66C9|nr:lipid A biosynthesis acyltransferase [Aliamphritea hakodatensis]